jgi:hypothetical protein
MSGKKTIVDNPGVGQGFLRRGNGMIVIIVANVN